MKPVPPKQFLSVSSLALLQIIIVVALEPQAANASYGFSLPFIYLLAAVGFLVPCILMVNKLAAAFPQTGGAYIWAELAFGKKMGFFAATFLWVGTLLWYPSAFSFIAVNVAYIINPALATNKLFVMIFSVSLYLLIFILNCLGVRISIRLSAISAVLGVIFPMILITSCGLYWWLSGHAFAISPQTTPWIPSVTHLSSLGFIISVTICFMGIEIPAVHAGNVMNPVKDFPKSLWVSGFCILVLSLATTLSVAIVVPAKSLNLLTGLFDAITLFFTAFHWEIILSVVFLFTLIGLLGCTMAWMMGASRGMYVACSHNHVSKFLQKKTRKDAPIGLLSLEAILYTCAMIVFYFFPTVTNSFWLLLVVATQVILLYYVCLFLAATKLMPTLFSKIMMVVGMLTAILSIIFGFFPPPGLAHQNVVLFHSILVGGILFAMGLPMLLLRLRLR